jgi:SAM-dependent methyltransferase
MSAAAVKLNASAAPAQAANQPAMSAEQMEWLSRQVATNRFLPVPPPGLHNVGDGDFRAIGAEFLRHFVGLGGLAPHHAVVEIGCGTGRMAVPLTQYLDPGVGSYDGVDIVPAGIAWCRRAITPAYPRFCFHHADVQNDLYNPEGAVAAADVALPFADGRFDFAVLTSVLTHLGPEATTAYAAEVARLLRPGGRCFVSLFLIDDVARQALQAPGRRLKFDLSAPGPAYYADPAHPLAAVAYEREFLIDAFARRGLVLAQPAAWGHWSGRPGLTYQDICVFMKPEAS